MKLSASEPPKSIAQINEPEDENGEEDVFENNDAAEKNEAENEDVTMEETPSPVPPTGTDTLKVESEDEECVKTTLKLSPKPISRQRSKSFKAGMKVKKGR